MIISKDTPYPSRCFLVGSHMLEYKCFINQVIF